MEKSTRKLSFYVQTFGCQMNEADSSEIGSHLFRRGWQISSSKENAELVVLNTCTVRQHAEDKALSFIGRLKMWKKKDPKRMIIITGCAAERLKKSLQRRFPFVDLVIGAKSIEAFPELVDSFLKKKSSASKTFDWFQESEQTFGEGSLRPSGPPMVLGSPEAMAFVTIMRGCNYSCSYCIVPQVRGRERYRPQATILEEIRLKIEQGFKDVMLLGQTVNSYPNFSGLVRAINQIENVRSIRFMSPHPYYMTDPLIDALSECEKVSPEIHLPVQSGSNRILALMKRNYTCEKYLSIYRHLKEKMPALSLTTDFIVGFPEETEEDFQATLRLARHIPFYSAYCFKYSPRQGTASAELKDDVPDSLKEKRLEALLKEWSKN